MSAIAAKESGTMLVNLSAEDKEKLRSFAKQLNWTMADVIRQLIRTAEIEHCPTFKFKP